VGVAAFAEFRSIQLMMPSPGGDRPLGRETPREAPLDVLVGHHRGCGPSYPIRAGAVTNPFRFGDETFEDDRALDLLGAGGAVSIGGCAGGERESGGGAQSHTKEGRDG
jgi:hypothetical protein